MSNLLPPLTALRAFEAAARHLSFQNAAAELHVTPAALSHQIKALEDRLGAPVFIRHNRQVELTDLGKVLQPGLSKGFEALHTAWMAAMRQRNHRQLTVTAGPGFMASFLAPRMSDFVLSHPELEFRLTASLALLNFQRDGIDLAVRFGSSSDEGYFSETLFRDWMTPMMSPQMAETLGGPEDLQPEDLVVTHYPGSLALTDCWPQWFEAQGLEPEEPAGPAFMNPESAITYVANGSGVAMGRVSLADSYLRSGQLVMPFPMSLRTAHTYRLVCPLGMETKQGVTQFRNWMRAQITDLDAYSEGRRFIDIK